MGNIVDTNLDTITYDSKGRLAKWVSGGSTTTMYYNALGQRVKKIVSGSASSVTAEFYDPEGRLIGVYTPNGNGEWDVIEELLYLDNFRVAATVRPDSTLGMNAPQVFPVLTDHLGSPRTIVDSAGAPQWEWTGYEAFGNQAPNEMLGSVRFVYNGRFAGQRFDESTSSLHNGFRTYNIKLGRYMQSDPLGLEAGWNTYAYVGNSPVEAMDPWGLSERDVKKINQIYNATLIDLNKKGRRSKHGDLLNNAFSVDEYGEFSSSPLTWLLNAINKPILGRDIVASDFGYQNFNEICVGQATILQNGLQSYRNAGTEEKPSFDDKWTFALVNNKNHYWVEAYSNNPNDPELMLDLWKNIRKTRPYGSGKRSPHLGKGVVWK